MTLTNNNVLDFEQQSFILSVGYNGGINSNSSRNSTKCQAEFTKFFRVWSQLINSVESTGC